MLKPLLFSVSLLFIFSVDASAQRKSSKKSPATSNVIIKTSNGKSTVRTGEQLILLAKGDDESVTMQWQASADGVNWKDVPQANGNNFETGAIASTQFYRIATRPEEGFLAIEQYSNVLSVSNAENVATTKKTRQ